MNWKQALLYIVRHTTQIQTDLKLCMLVNVFGSLSVQDELGLIGYSDNMIFHGVTQKSESNKI